MTSRNLLRNFSAAVILAGLIFGGISSQASAEDAPVVSASSVGVQLFEWNWNSVARECTSNLGPAGYNWVEVSPPQEHILGSKWWVHYQPTSYKLESSLGTRAEFANMVDTCGKAGVAIIVDAVINHMAASDTDGWAGTKHTKYDYPGLYTKDDFHHCKSATGGIDNWNDLTQVQECELLGLADLNTSSPKVQATLVGYLKDLRSLGVKGFRVDAAKHIAVADLKAIVTALPSDTSWLFEVYDGPAAPSQYQAFGNTFGFDWAKSTKSMFTVSGLVNGQASDRVLRTLDASAATINLVANHDTERDGSTLNYKAGKRFELASMFMLAIPYGKPMIFSGYAFSDRDAAPFSDNNGMTKDALCPTVAAATAKAPQDGLFVCEHRWAGITGMIQWRKTVADASVQTVYSKGGQYGFSRGNLGYVLFNTSAKPVTLTVKTAMPAGSYCNLAISGTLTPSSNCPTAAKVVVSKTGTAKLSVAGWSAAAIAATSKLN